MTIHRITLLSRSLIAAVLFSGLAAFGAQASDGRDGRRRLPDFAHWIEVHCYGRGSGSGHRGTARLALKSATLHGMDGMGFGVFHAEWLMGTKYDNAAYHHRLNRQLSLALGFASVRRPKSKGIMRPGWRRGNSTMPTTQPFWNGLLADCRDHRGLGAKYFSEKLDASSRMGSDSISVCST